MKKLLIIEDDTGISSSLKLYLMNSGFEVWIYHEWFGAIDEIKTFCPDLIILDINLPDKDGIQITKELRQFSSLPVIMLTARWSEEDRIEWLDVWADDYIAKPFSPRELLSRINTILRRIQDKNTKTSKIHENIDILEHKWIKILLSTSQLYYNDLLLKLTSNEFNILVKLMQNIGETVSRKVIMKDVFGFDNYAADRTIDTHIKNIRKKIWVEDFIKTIRGQWYIITK